PRPRRPGRLAAGPVHRDPRLHDRLEPRRAGVLLTPRPRPDSPAIPRPPAVVQSAPTEVARSPPVRARPGAPMPSFARTALVAAALAACAPGEGTLEVSVYGEEFIEETIPADAFVDGWTVTFDKFL